MYSGDPSTENCIEYRDALQVFINSGCAGSEQSSFEGLLDLLPCN
jgi:hypothetical protein